MVALFLTGPDGGIQMGDGNGIHFWVNSSQQWSLT